jgi:GNAT superfamily N-acetyltransferase
MTITINQERYSDVLAREFVPLLNWHWQEIANDKDRIPLDVNFEAYKKLDSEGKIVILTARDDKRLIGYSIFFLVRSPHYKGTLVGMNDVLYLDPEYRRGSAGSRLIAESERVMREMGVVKITWHVKLVNGLQRILEAKGYKVDEIMMGKVL